MIELVSEAGNWALICFLLFVFIATAGHLMGLIVLPRAWKISGVVLVAFTFLDWVLAR